MNTKNLATLTGLFGACAATAMAGTIITEPTSAPVATHGFENARRPISNPTLFE